MPASVLDDAERTSDEAPHGLAEHEAAPPAHLQPMADPSYAMPAAEVHESSLPTYPELAPPADLDPLLPTHAHAHAHDPLGATPLASEVAPYAAAGHAPQGYDVQQYGQAPHQGYAQPGHDPQHYSPQHYSPQRYEAQQYAQNPGYGSQAPQAGHEHQQAYAAPQPGHEHADVQGGGYPVQAMVGEAVHPAAVQAAEPIEHLEEVAEIDDVELLDEDTGRHFIPPEQ